MHVTRRDRSSCPFTALAVERTTKRYEPPQMYSTYTVFVWRYCTCAGVIFRIRETNVQYIYCVCMAILYICHIYCGCMAILYICPIYCVCMAILYICHRYCVCMAILYICPIYCVCMAIPYICHICHMMGCACMTHPFSQCLLRC
jgi:hypothetical protein